MNSNMNPGGRAVQEGASTNNGGRSSWLCDDASQYQKESKRITQYRGRPALQRKYNK